MSDPSVRLRTAIKENNYFIASRLLKRYPNLLDNIDPENGWSNLHYAAYHNDYQITETILKAIYTRFMSFGGGEMDRNSSQRLKKPDSSVYTQITDEDEIKLTFQKETVLHVACQGNSPATLHLLLSYFNVCLDQRDMNGYTPSHICCINGHPECLAILLNQGAYPNIQDNVGDTPLHKAFQYSHMKCIKLLIKYNADDQLFNNLGWKPVDVAFDTDIIKRYNSLKEDKSFTVELDTQSITKIPESKYGPHKTPQTSSHGSFVSTYNSGGMLNDPQPRFNLPSIQPRKFSLSSMISDEYEDLDSVYDLRSSGSSKNSRNSSPSMSSTNVNNSSLFALRKPPPPVLPELRQSPTQLSFSQRSNSMSNTTSPRKPLNNGGHSISVDSTPASKRSSLSTRTFRSSSQLSDFSPVKSEMSQIDEQNSGASSIESNAPTPKHSKQPSHKSSINTPYPLSLQVEEASSKLQDFKLKNKDRLKLDTKLGNIINNSSQDNLISPTSFHFNGVSSSLFDNNDVKNQSVDKRSKVLSIPILSSRAKHNP